MPTDVPHLAIDGLVETWEDAEHLAAVALRCMGFEVEVTGPGTDAGIDVAGPEVVGQVKFQERRVGRPELQRLVGAADGHRSVFFASSGYSAAALAFADERDVALFSFTVDGLVQPDNEPAAALLGSADVVEWSPELSAIPEPTVDERRARVEDDLRALRRWRKALVTMKGPDSRRVRAFDRDMAKVEKAHARLVVVSGRWRRRPVLAALADVERRIDDMVQRHRIAL